MKLRHRVALNYARIKLRLISIISPKSAAASALNLFCTPQSRSRSPLANIFDSGEKLGFQLQGITIRGFRWNRGSDKKILIIHGFQSSMANFGHFIKPLTSKGYEVLAFDAPGHGISDGHKITAPLFAQMITTIINIYGPVKSFIAHSFGGLALALAVENIPHDAGWRVVLIAPATETKTAVDQFFHLLRLSVAVRNHFNRLIAEMGGHPVEWYSISRAIKNLDATILWIHDRDDMQTPLADALKVNADHSPNLTFHITSNLGHRRIYRDPAIIQLILDFLD